MAEFELFGGKNSADEVVREVVKTSESQTVNNSTTFVDDDSLFVSLDSGDKYFFEFQIWWTTDVDADFKFRVYYNGTETYYYIAEFAAPGGATMVREEVRTADNIWTANDDTGTGFGRVTGVIMPTSSDDLRIEWAQATADISDTIVKIGSRLRVQKFA